MNKKGVKKAAGHYCFTNLGEASGDLLWLPVGQDPWNLIQGALLHRESFYKFAPACHHARLKVGLRLCWFRSILRALQAMK